MKEGFSWEKTLPVVTACLCMIALLINHIVTRTPVDGTFVTLLAGIFASSAGAAIVSAKKKLDTNDSKVAAQQGEKGEGDVSNTSNK